MFPSLDMVVFNIDKQFLKASKIKVVDLMKPDSRFLTMASIGYSQPKELDYKEWRHKYGCSRNVSRVESVTVNPNKAVSLGKVKSYGSITTVINSVGQGSQGSPCFNELGKCWGFLVGSHNDIPPKPTEEVF